MSVLSKRASGILLHPTSFPGRYGIGDLGAVAYRFVDYIAAAGQSYWQILPLGPTGYGESPYQALSAFAGNTLLISLDALADKGWLDRAELAVAPEFPSRIDYSWVMWYSNEMLSKAYQGFLEKHTPADKEAFETWRAANADWVDDFALFMAIKESHNLSEWTSWPDEEADYKKAVVSARDRHQARYQEHLFRQWVFYSQWDALKTYANQKGIKIIGDLPIFVAHDSADVWSQRDLFFLDGKGMPPVVTGVPPDSFNPEAGQRWGHPVYKWKRHQETHFEWWIKRVKASLALVDVVRIDHFRGFWDYFEVPATDLYTTKNGRWMDGPRDSLFDAFGPDLRAQIIAEDLGDRMEEVIVWREKLGLPGMKILQFAFGGSEEEQIRFGPDKIEANAVVYTGTHDNNTTLGWWQTESDEWQHNNMVKAFECLREGWTKTNKVEPFGQDAQQTLDTPHWVMIQIGMMSGGNTLVIPLQDVLGVDASGRMNFPGDPDLSKNWKWRYAESDLTDSLRDLLLEMTRYHHRA